MKKTIALSCTLAVLSGVVSAREVATDPCDNVKPEGREIETKDIYPFVPLKTECVKAKISRLLEGGEYIMDIREITKRGLTSAKTKTQPWGGSFWPLNQGQIANPYQEKDYTIFHGALNGLEVVSWKYNYNKFKKRKERIHAKILELSEKELAELAPSEKYDLLLGDLNFDLTNRVWQYAATWGEEKKWGFLSSIELPAGYRIPKANERMALWEGICHGWAVASGHTPRPNGTVWVKLPNGKSMPFYPNDIKALISLMWANSTIQDSVISEGLRCNRVAPKRDEHGRFIDVKPDKGDENLLPRCADVHPAVYHASIVNMLGIEGRSFVVDKSSKASVSNQPVAGYEYKYFNPETGKEGSLMGSVIDVRSYDKDPFKAARNPDTKYIVGVDMKLKYIDWEDPIMKETNYPSDDHISDLDFNYDLELDKNYNIIGGQWRVKKDGNRRLMMNNTNQPDFFWVVPRNYKKYFQPISGLPTWDFNQSTIPPKEFKTAAQSAHAFIYQQTKEFGWNEKCEVFPMEGEGPMLKVPCEFKYPRPQPLINVVNTLLEQARR